MSKTICIAAALLLGPAAGVWASEVNTGQVFVSPNFSGGTGPFSQTIDNAGAIDISGSATGGFGSSGSASLHLEPGIIKLAGEFSGSGNAIARGILRDSLVFSSPVAPAGTVVDVTFSIFVDGSLFANDVGAPVANWLLQAGLGGGAFDITRSGSMSGNGPYSLKHGYSGDPFGWYSGTTQVQLGVPALLDIEFSGSAQASYEFDSGVPSASFSLDHSLYWGGISDVSASGISLTSYSVTSESGLDYSKSLAPVPEPSSFSLGILGFGCLLVQRVHRRIR